ncbi:GNAT family N-acetyltransferase [Psychrilyobacter atlanticus]|uniref:GNAT family N-acetyltransferase n=1 Tax=Psychrilyobacter atlanticus TaxID=271091 RepID=UPI0003F631F3|nr:GNAT family N-acetyltransferase [Psychrilyobacter atlanticus]
MKADNIRKAKKEDKVVDLIMSAAGEIFLPMDPSFKNEKAREVCKFLFQSEYNKLSFENCFVYEKNNTIMGMVIVYDQNLEISLGENQSSILLEEYNVDVNFPIEGIKNSYYIDSIAVGDKYQGQGIGKSLLQFITDKFNPCGLIVDVEKTSARSLYEKMGFKILNNIDLFGNHYYQMKTNEKI